MNAKFILGNLPYFCKADQREDDADGLLHSLPAAGGRKMQAFPHGFQLSTLADNLNTANATTCDLHKRRRTSSATELADQRSSDCFGATRYLTQPVAPYLPP